MSFQEWCNYRKANRRDGCEKNIPAEIWDEYWDSWRDGRKYRTTMERRKL